MAFVPKARECALTQPVSAACRCWLPSVRSQTNVLFPKALVKKATFGTPFTRPAANALGWKGMRQACAPVSERCAIAPPLPSFARKSSPLGKPGAGSTMPAPAKFDLAVLLLESFTRHRNVRLGSSATEYEPVPPWVEVGSYVEK